MPRSFFVSQVRLDVGLLLLVSEVVRLEALPIAALDVLRLCNYNFDADNEVHFLPAQVVGSTIRDIGFGGGETPCVHIRAAVCSAPQVERCGGIRHSRIERNRYVKDLAECFRRLRVKKVSQADYVSKKNAKFVNLYAAKAGSDKYGSRRGQIIE